MNIVKVVVGKLDTNCYIVENSETCLIIDPGDDFEKIVSNVNKKVVGILLTHSHFDHVGALELCREYYKTEVYDVTNLNEGINKINDFSFEVIYNFGHTMDSISFIFDNNMFSGDFIFNGTIGRCDLGGDFELMKESIKKILNRNTNYKIYPGHGDLTYLFEEKSNLDYWLK